VTFNGVEAYLTNATANEIKAFVPANAGSGKIVVEANGNVIEGPQFLYISEPSATLPYYFRFKMNGTFVEFTTNVKPDFSRAGGTNVVDYLLNPDSGNGDISLRFCLADNLASTVDQLAGKSLIVRKDLIPLGAFLSFRDGGGKYFESGSQGETVEITDVKYYGSMRTVDVYEISGTFTLKVKDDFNVFYNLTEGTFHFPVGTAQ
jgi:hypothetical protein